MEKFILKTTVLGFVMQTEQAAAAFISNARNTWKFYKNEGFTDIETVLEYVEKYFKINREQITIK